jgi:hypothetical protein
MCKRTGSVGHRADGSQHPLPPGPARGADAEPPDPADPRNPMADAVTIIDRHVRTLANELLGGATRRHGRQGTGESAYDGL